jgi:OmpA-OmpF porin, OOP family
MYYRILILIFSIFSSKAISQINLVPNGSFETYTACPWIYDYIEYSGSWYEPSCGTSDLYNDCDSSQTNADVPKNFLGYQTSHNGGNGYGGLIAYKATSWVASHREYIECRLTSPMDAGTLYYVSFFASLANNSTHGINTLGMYISSQPVSATTPYPDCASILPYVPQIRCASNRFLTDTLKWEQISGAYNAKGGEQYIIIGNFSDNAHTDTVRVPTGSTWPAQAYYYIDDVCISSHYLVCNVDPSVSVTEIAPELQFRHDKINKTLLLNQQIRILSYRIASIHGNLVQNGSNPDNAEIDLSQLHAGVYCIVLAADSHLYYRKLLID